MPPPPAPVPPKRRLSTWAWIVIGVVGFALGIVLSPIFAVVLLVVLITGTVALVRNTPTWLRFRSRRVATWVTAVSAAGLLLTGGIANLVLPRTADERAPASAVTTAPLPSATPSATPMPKPSPTEIGTEVLAVIDGDTIDTSTGRVRLIGIDAPEQGQWGYDQATQALSAFLAGGAVSLVAVDGRDDTDRYDRLLRYVQVNGRDAGTHLLTTGWAIARYDGRDGYGAHPLQDQYIALDEGYPMPAEPVPEPPPAPVEPAPADPAPATDPRFGTCREANANGYGNYQAGADPEYEWYRDADKDGWVCE